MNTKIKTLGFLLIAVLLTMQIVPASAQGTMPSNNASDQTPPPTIEVVKKFTNSEMVEYDSTGIFIYDGSTLVDRYRAGEFLYEVDTTNNQIVQFSPISDENYTLNGVNTIDRRQFGPKAAQLIMNLAPEINLNHLNHVVEENNPFYFRWENENLPKLLNGDSQYVQVVYMPDGRIFSYINTIISSKDHHITAKKEIRGADHLTGASIKVLGKPLLYPIYTLYAPGSYFTTSGGTFTLVSGCYGGTNCYVVSGGGTQLGTWTYYMFLRSDVYAYVPNIAYSLSDRARYYAYYNDGGSTLTITLCNQQLRKNGYCYLITGKQNFSKAQLSCSITATNLYCAYDEVFINNN